MTLKYLLDENVDSEYKIQLTRNHPHLIVWVVGEPNAPPRGTLDPQILNWCEEYSFVLVTNNRRSMPVHLAEHIARGNHIPGILIFNPKLSMGENLDELAFLAEASLENEHQDQIIYLPFSK